MTDVCKWMQQVGWYTMYYSVYVYIPNHVLTPAMGHTLKMARMHPGNRGWTSTSRQLRQHASPFLVIMSRSRAFVRNMEVLSFKYRTEVICREETCVSKNSIKEQAQKRMVQRFTSANCEPGWSGDRILVGTRFSAPVQASPGAYPASYTMGTGSFPGVKRPGGGVNHPPPFSAEVKV